MAAEDENLFMADPMSDEVGDREIFGYRNMLKIKRGSDEVHIILADATPIGVATFDSAPVGSFLLSSVGGDDATAFLKEATGATGWAAITTAAAG